MLLYILGILLLVSLGIGAIIAITYFIMIAIIRRPVPIDLATKRITIKGTSLDYQTCVAIALQVSVGKQVAYSLVFSFPGEKYWVYPLTDNHATTLRVQSNKQIVAAMIDEMRAIPQTSFETIEVNRLLGSLFGRQRISIGRSEAKQYLYASRSELNKVFQTIKKS